MDLVSAAAVSRPLPPRCARARERMHLLVALLLELVVEHARCRTLVSMPWIIFLSFVAESRGFRGFDPEEGEGIGLTENIVSKLGELQAQRLELVLGLGAQRVAPRRPEARDRGAHGRVVVAGELVRVAGEDDLALDGGVDAVDLGGSEDAEGADVERLGEGVDAGVLEELGAGVVEGGDGGVGFEGALAGQLAGEVLAGVEVFEEAGDGVDVVFEELYPPDL